MVGTADGEGIAELLSPVLEHLQRMEAELKCSICLNLLSMPTLLPCNHMFCSVCIDRMSIQNSPCPACNSPFLSRDLRPANHMATVVAIFEDIDAAMGTLISDPKMSRKETFVSGNKHIKEEDAHMRPRGKIDDVRLHSPPIGDVIMSGGKDDGGSNEYVMLRSKKCLQNSREDSFAHQQQPCNLPSFGDDRGSDHDSNDQGGKQITKRSTMPSLSKNDVRVEDNVITKEVPTSAGSTSAGTQHTRRSNDSTGKYDNSSARDSVKRSKRQKLKSAHSKHSWKMCRNLYTDECVFCHSFRTTQASGPMLCYVNGKLEPAENINESDVMHVHKNCVEWAPQIYFSGDTVMNFGVELARASKIKCSKCGLKGAALGCYYENCRKSFHVPCAVEIPECRWDCENFFVLCPSHIAQKLPCDDKSDAGKKIVDDHSSEDQIECLNSPGVLEEQQRNEPPTDQLSFTNEWVIIGSALSPSENELTSKFTSSIGVTLADTWSQDVTHVITSTTENGACKRTHKVLMAILSGKWVLKVEWIKACMEARRPLPEEDYEVGYDAYGYIDGPKKGRIRAMEKTPKLFTGRSFYILGYFMPSYKRCLEDLVVAAGATLFKEDDVADLVVAAGVTALKEDDVITWDLNSNISSPKAYVVYDEDPPLEASPRYVIKEKAITVASMIGARVIDHARFLNAIAAFDAELLD